MCVYGFISPGSGPVAVRSVGRGIDQSQVGMQVRVSRSTNHIFEHPLLIHPISLIQSIRSVRSVRL